MNLLEPRIAPEFDECCVTSGASRRRSRSPHRWAVRVLHPDPVARADPSRRFEHDPLLAHVARRAKNGRAVRLVALLRGAALVPIFSGPRRVRSRPLTDMTPLWRRICLRHTVAEPLRAGARHDDHLLGRRGRRSSNRTGGPRGFAMLPVAVSAGYISGIPTAPLKI
jgi:hypothetical protein